jgi:poly(3-hydroxybutyrate) depolymerase
MNMIGWDITSDADVKFMTALIDAMAARYKIDRNRVYSTGFSMGGMLSYVLACRMSDKIAAIGPDGGYPVGQNAGNCKPSAPVPVIHVHGANNTFVTYSGVAPWIKKIRGSKQVQTVSHNERAVIQGQKRVLGPLRKWKRGNLLYDGRDGS